MLEIFENQSFEMRNILTIRKWMSQLEAQETIRKMLELCRENNVDNKGFMVTSSLETKLLEGQIIIDTEIMIPLNRSFDVTSPFYFKDYFKLVHAIQFKSEYALAMGPDFQDVIANYMKEKSLEPITRAYTVTYRNKSDEKGILDVYIGVSPNIL